MPSDKPNYTKKEEEIISTLQENGQVIINDIKDLKSLGKKLEKALGTADVS